MEHLIERLRASKLEFEQREKTNGKNEGRAWAVARASFEQLSAVADLEFDRESGGYASQFDQAIGNDPYDWKKSFWCANGYSDVPTDLYVEAFVEAAQEVWDDVADKL